MTVDVKGNSPLWLKVKDLAEGMTYRFRIKAKTFTYGPEIEANITTGPGEGKRGVSVLYAPHPPSKRDPGGLQIVLKRQGSRELITPLSPAPRLLSPSLALFFDSSSLTVPSLGSTLVLILGLVSSI